MESVTFPLLNTLNMENYAFMIFVSPEQSENVENFLINMTENTLDANQLLNDTNYVSTIDSKTRHYSNDKGGENILHIKNQLPYICDYCELDFNDIEKLKIHYLMHVNGKPYTCELCDMEFSQSSFLKKHYSTHPIEDLLSCDVCQKRFYNNESLRDHYEISHADEPLYFCEVCKKEFLRENDLKTHSQIHSCKPPYNCHICNEVFTDIEFLKQHYMVHSDKINFFCNMNEELSSRTELQKQCLTNAKKKLCEKTYNCPFCKEKFSTLVDFTKHQRKFHPNKYICKSCCLPYTSVHSLANHSNTPMIKRQSYTCFVCKSVFSCPSRLKIHYRTHSKEKPFVCEICDNHFAEKYTLLRHYKIHTKEQPYQCGICKKKFSHQGNMKMHMRVIHTDYKPVKGDIQRKSFKVKEVHLNRINTLKKTKNPTLLKEDPYNGPLNIHYMFDVLENSYECSKCKMKFSSTRNLQHHQRNHTEDDILVISAKKDFFKVQD